MTTDNDKVKYLITKQTHTSRVRLSLTCNLLSQFCPMHKLLLTTFANLQQAYIEQHLNEYWKQIDTSYF